MELDEYISGFRAKNKQFANEVDRIFVIKKQKDEETKKLDTQIQEVHELIRCKIADLDTDKLALYSQLLGFSLELSKSKMLLSQILIVSFPKWTTIAVINDSISLMITHNF